MPRRNPERSLAEEGNLRRRMAFERERRGWSYDGLAKRMTDAGCPINQSALYKTEKGDPPRRITVAELVALASVFDLPIAELLLPPEVVGRHELAEKFIAWHDARDAEGAAIARTAELWTQLRDYVKTQPGLEGDLETFVGIWMDHDFPTADPDEAKAYWMWKLTESDVWKKQALPGVKAEQSKGRPRGKHQAKA